MKQILMAILLLCGVWPFSSTAQIGVADPETGNALIDFYGRVVDQQGRPLAGAKVTLSILVGYLSSPNQLATRYDKTILASDTDGHFTITGAHGHSVQVESIELKGYEVSETITRLYPYSWAAYIFQPDPKNPVPFVLWDEGQKKALIIEDKHFDFIPDGRAYILDFRKHTIAQATNSEGDFQFSLTRPGGMGKSSKFDWSFSFRGQSGNMLQRSQKGYFEMVFPPQEGFTNIYEEAHKASDQDWKRGGRGEFFIKMHDGQSYGKAAFIWDAVAAGNGPKTNEAGIRIRYTINPTGSTLAQ